MDRKRTLESGWEALWTDLELRCSDEQALRQAYKNGAAIVAARLKLRGKSDIETISKHGQDHVLQVFWPWIMANLQYHSDWSEPHRDALVAGMFAAVMLIVIGAPLLKDLANFTP